MTNQIDEKQFKDVADLLRRQDEALENLDLLAQKIELAIESNLQTRSAEQGGVEDNEPAVINDDSERDFGQRAA